MSHRLLFCFPVLNSVTLYPDGVSEDEDADVEEGEEEVNLNLWSQSGFGEGEGKEKYALFLSLFVRCFVADDQKVKGSSGRTHYELMSTYMPVPLEAFAVVMYTNNYKKFIRTHWKHDSEDLSSSLGTPGSIDTLFTSDGRGAGKYGGWSEQGMEFYNRVYEVLERQRARPCRRGFEEKLRKLVQQSNQGGKKRKRNSIPVRNGIAMLTHLVSGDSSR
jgi:hypothetical protein